MLQSAGKACLGGVFGQRAPLDLLFVIPGFIYLCIPSGWWDSLDVMEEWPHGYLNDLGCAESWHTLSFLT